MSAIVAAGRGVGAGAAAPGRQFAQLQLYMLWLLALSGAFAIIEPSPYEACFLVTLVIFAIGGLKAHRKLIPLIVLLAIFNVGGVLSLVPHADNARSVQYVLISLYLAVTTAFFAMLMAEDQVARLDKLKYGFAAAAAFASVCGILGYFDVAGLSAIFTLNNRASGSFKDPNVLGPFCTVALVWLAQDLIVGRGRWWLTLPVFLLILFGGVFLSFSRGAWGVSALTIVMSIALAYLTTGEARVRRRIMLACFVGAGILTVAFAIAMSFEQIRSVFEIRASLKQDYDLGETGRFGNQLRSIPKLLDYPNGFGPLQFRTHFVDDPHNVYINAFASYGWIGGISYLALVAATIMVGWRVVFTRAPWQPHAVALWPALFVQTLQGFQIDTDHWRHWFMLLGLIWGMAAANASPPRAPAGTSRPVRTS